MYDIKGWDPIFQYQITDHIIENDKLNLWLCVCRRFPNNDRIEDKNQLENYKTALYMHYKVIQPVLLTILNYKNVCYSIGKVFHQSFLKEDERSFSIIGGLTQYKYTIKRYWTQVISLLKQYYSVQITKVSRIGLYKITKQRDLERFATMRGINYYNNRIVVKDPNFKPYENADIYHSIGDTMEYFIISIADNHIYEAPFKPDNTDSTSVNFFYSRLEKNFSYKNTMYIKFMNTENTCYKNDDNLTQNTLPYSIRLKNFNDMLYYCIVTANYNEIINGYKNKIMNEYDRKIIDKVRNRETVTNIEFLNPSSKDNLLSGIGDDLVESVMDVIGWNGNLIDRDNDSYNSMNNPYHDSILYFESYADNVRFPKRSTIRFTYKYQC